MVAAMAKAGFVPGSQEAYARALEQFGAKLDRKGLAEATAGDGRRYLSRLKQSGVAATFFSHASAALRFFFESVRGVTWKPLSPLRLRNILGTNILGTYYPFYNILGTYYPFYATEGSVHLRFRL